MFTCPLCNGLLTVSQLCPRCGLPLADGGKIEDYYGPYSPYQDDWLFDIEQAKEKGQVQTCPHLFYCPRCSTHLIFPVQLR
ncbi:MAG: hypothetical protein PWQ91_857 [Eubacteriales bacterium]|nr:hypothetical protein [Eubacteriales bacterium]MDN5363796.1 hypothetical protein [Eubacteriales bacterium]